MTTLNDRMVRTFMLEPRGIHLIRHGYSIYPPRYLKRRRHARCIDTVEAPLFPRHLFVAFDPIAQRWRSIQSSIGVTRLVRNGEQPATVPQAVVDELKSREDKRGFVRLDLRPRFMRGDKIQIVDGVFDACFGLFGVDASAWRSCSISSAASSGRSSMRVRSR